MSDAREHTSRGGALPLSPALDDALATVHMPRRTRTLEPRVVRIALLAIVLGLAASIVAKGLVALIGLITNLAFYRRWSAAFVAPTTQHLGAWVIVVPVAGGMIIGIMARWGSTAIRGHGIPEAMEQILRNESRVPPRVSGQRPVSCAIAMGTSGPFAAGDRSGLLVVVQTGNRRHIVVVINRIDLPKVHAHRLCGHLREGGEECR